MIGQKFSFQDGKYNVEVTSIELYGNEEKLVIKTGLKGSLNGAIFFKGVPYYNPIDKSLSLKNFDYDLNTSNLLHKTAAWMFQGKLKKNMENAFVFPIGEQIEQNRKEIQSYLASNKVAKGVTLSGKIDNVEPFKVYVNQNAIKSIIYANGKMNLNVEGL